MLLFDFKCSDGHIGEHLVSKTELEVTCTTCGLKALRIFTPTRGRALWFEEGRARTIQNLTHLGPHNVSNRPPTITSRKAHEEAMNREGVHEATASEADKFSKFKDKVKDRAGRWV